MLAIERDNPASKASPRITPAPLSTGRKIITASLEGTRVLADEKQGEP
jgi:hypothetical protein